MDSNKQGMKRISPTYYLSDPTLGVSVNLQRELSLSLGLNPNPAANELHATLSGASGSYAFHIIDEQGRLVRVVSSMTGIAPQTLDVHDLPSGNYILEAHCDGGITRAKFAIIR